MAGTSAAWQQYMGENGQGASQWGPNTYLNPFDPWVDPALVNRNPLLWWGPLGPNSPQYPPTPFVDPTMDPLLEEEVETKFGGDRNGEDPMGGRGYEGVWDKDFWGGSGFTPEAVGFGGLKNLQNAMGLMGGFTKGGLLGGLFSKALDPRNDMGLMGSIEQMIGAENMPALQQTLEKAFGGLTPGNTMSALMKGTFQSNPMAQNVLNSTQTAIGAAMQRAPGMQWLGDVGLENLHDIPGGYAAAKSIADSLGISVQDAAKALAQSGATNMGALGNLGTTFSGLDRAMREGLIGSDPSNQYSDAYDKALERAATGSIARSESRARMNRTLNGDKTGGKVGKVGGIAGAGIGERVGGGAGDGPTGSAAGGAAGAAGGGIGGPAGDGKDKKK